MYTIFQQPPFSKSAGNGSSHQNVGRPNSIRIGYLDALARLTGNTYAADFVRRTLKVEPDYMKKALLNKPGDLAWFQFQGIIVEDCFIFVSKGNVLCFCT